MGLFIPFYPQFGRFGWAGPDSTRVSGIIILLLDPEVPLSSPTKAQWKYSHFLVLENFLLPLHRAYGQFSIY